MQVGRVQGQKARAVQSPVNIRWLTQACGSLSTQSSGVQPQQLARSAPLADGISRYIQEREGSSAMVAGALNSCCYS